jgi:redox-sensitive bicupin YhaK (pirin superfamily)
MMKIRRAGERGHAEHGWLDSWHTFSFADYHDPAHMGFRNLRVLNDDRVQPGRGFGTHAPRHGDRDVRAGGRARAQGLHGNGSIIRPGDVQRMSAGTGVLHSE